MRSLKYTSDIEIILHLTKYNNYHHKFNNLMPDITTTTVQQEQHFTTTINAATYIKFITTNVVEK